MKKDNLAQTVMGNLIASFREQRNKSLTELSDASGISIAAVGRIERGASNPTLTTVLQLAKGLEMKPFDLMSMFEKAFDETQRVVHDQGLDQVQGAKEGAVKIGVARALAAPKKSQIKKRVRVFPQRIPEQEKAGESMITSEDLTYEEHLDRMREHKEDVEDALEEFDAGRIDKQTLNIWWECADKHFDR